MNKCTICDKNFKTEASRKQHMRDKHRIQDNPIPNMSKEGARAVMEEMADLPDGAFFAMAADLGLDPEDFIDNGNK